MLRSALGWWGVGGELDLGIHWTFLNLYSALQISTQGQGLLC